MPECWRCHRVQATAELRRTSRGYLCKENAKGSRCHTLARQLREQGRRRKTGEQLSLKETLP